jgi:hypothetical protein
MNHWPAENDEYHDRERCSWLRFLSLWNTLYTFTPLSSLTSSTVHKNWCLFVDTGFSWRPCSHTRKRVSVAVLVSVMHSFPQKGTLCNNGETVESLEYRWVVEVGRVELKLSTEFFWHFTHLNHGDCYMNHPF